MVVYENSVDVGEYNALRAQAGWGALPPEQAEQSLKNSAFKISARADGETVGVARMLWDGGYTAYLADVIVREGFRGKGIGTALVKMLVGQLEASLKSGWKAKIVLLSALGRESFYEQFGFVKRPNPTEGCGMNLVVGGLKVLV